MPEHPVINASPLILLAKAQCLDLLTAVGERIIVPQAVAEEVSLGREVPGKAFIPFHDWFDVVEPMSIPALVAAADLGPGESAVLAWAAAHRGAEALLDDWAARRCAERLELACRGTIGVVLAAKKRGLIPAAAPALERLRHSGLYLSARLFHQALAVAGEAQG